MASIMRIAIVNLVFLLFGPTQNLWSQTADGTSFAQMISIDSLKNIVYHLASDRMGGREAGTLQSRMAISYITEKFERSDLLPFNETYLQSFPFPEKEASRKKYYRPGTLSLNKKVFEYVRDFFLPSHLEAQNNLKVEGIIFLTTDISKWTDKNQINGKAVLLLPGITLDTDSSLSGVIGAYHSAKEYGAKAVLVPSVQFFENQAKGHRPDYVELYSDIRLQDQTVPIISISWNVVKSLIGKKDMSRLFQDIKNGNLKAYDLPKGKLKLTWNRVTFHKAIANVIGFIPGRQLNNLVVIGAHFDHVGISNQQIYNGADDNASGVAGLLEMARVFSNALTAGLKPERSIAFVAFNGEEAGLWGSYAFVRSINTKDSVYAMINMDMIGRNEFKDQLPKIYVLGYDENSAKWKPMLKKVQETFGGLKLDYRFNRNNDPDHFLERSDQYPFLKENIPALFFFDNMEEDYHRPTDIAEKIDYPLLEKRVKFIFLTAWQLAYGENPKFRKYR